MALLTDLTDVIAKVEGLPETFVAGVARYLREAEYIRQGGRGLSAAKMLPEDAANLLIGVNATRLAKDAVDSIERYRNLEWASINDFDGRSNERRWDLLRAVFVEEITLTAVLANLINLSIRVDESQPPLGSLFLDDDLRMQITFARPKNFVQVEIGSIKSGRSDSVLSGVFFKLPEENPPGDREDLVSISHRTILEVGAVLSS